MTRSRDSNDDRGRDSEPPNGNDSATVPKIVEAATHLLRCAEEKVSAVRRREWRSQYYVIFD